MHRRSLLLLLTTVGVAAVVVLAACSDGQAATPTTVLSTLDPTATPSSPIPAGTRQSSVVRVVDGDTVDVSIGGAVERIRLIGIDTPETVDPRRPVQCFGKEASDRAKQLLDGETVWVEADQSQGERDSFGRTLAYLWLADGRLFNHLMIKDGYAHEYTYNLPYKYQTEFKQAEREARDFMRGLWSTSTCGGDTTRAASTAIAVPMPGATGIAAPTPGPTVALRYDPLGPDRDCGDFSTWREAQDFYLAAGGPATDPHRLDGDNDGMACETLPGAP